MPTSIDIASNALLLIGDNPISSFNDSGAGAQVAAAIYPETKKRVLASHPWSFALKQQYLNRLSQTPEKVTGYQYAFQLPTDMIRLWNTQINSNYIIVGQLLYSNQQEILATYIHDVDEVNIPPHAVKAMEYTLAADFAIAITEDNAMSQIFEQKAMTKTAEAMAIDSQNRPSSAIVNSPLIDARFGSTRVRGIL